MKSKPVLRLAVLCFVTMAFSSVGCTSSGLFPRPSGLNSSDFAQAGGEGVGLARYQTQPGERVARAMTAPDWMLGKGSGSCATSS